MKKVFFITIFFFLLFIQAGQSTELPALIRINLGSGWQFSESGKSEWFPAMVPGNIFTDLYANKIIEDPFFRNNEKNLQWVEKRTWVYKTIFSIDKQQLKADFITLKFKGLDTYTEIFINGQKLSETTNMFLEYNFDVKNLIKAGKNELKIVFHPTTHIADSLYNKLTCKLPDDSRVMVRKAPYQFGWDWGPRFVGCGIWQPVYLEFGNNFLVKNISFDLDTLSPDHADLNVKIKILTKILADLNIILSDENHSFTAIQKNIQTGSSESEISIHICIRNPKLWYPNGWGEAYLYHFILRLQSGEFSQTFHQNFGIRQVEYLMEKDSIGQAFGFKINGIPVFMKGANYIPQDVFPSRVTYNQYKNLLELIKNSNMNMLRVWGGGIYENDCFYDLCDSLGILVWQDFMFACGMYPGDEKFLKSIAQEADYQVNRLRNHPSIILWCGNNEVDEGWKNWGWQEKYRYTQSDSAEIWDNYLKITDILGSAVKRINNDEIKFIPSSPLFGWGHPESMTHGDAHYWGVWWGEEPFDVYEKKVGRFMSEYGFQGIPGIETLSEFALPDDLCINSEVLKTHQKHPRGYELIKKYMERDYKVPSDFKDYVYVSQVVQAEGIAKAIEAHRRAKPYCMGTLFWQLNDCWPVTSWSSIDYSGGIKAMQYFVKKAFEDVIISFSEDSDNIYVWLVTESQIASGNLKVQLLSFTDSVPVWEKDTIILVKANESFKCFTISKNSLKGIDSCSHLIYASILLNDSFLVDKIHYLAKPKYLKLPDPKIKSTITKTRAGYSVVLQSVVLAKNVCIGLENADFQLSENYFDILPGESKLVYIGCDNPLEIKLTMKSLSQIK